MTNLPVELHLKIAASISNMWDRQKYLMILRLDNKYYQGKSRPPSKQFVPRAITDQTKIPYWLERSHKVVNVLIPIEGTGKSLYFDVVQAGVNFFVETRWRIIHTKGKTTAVKYLWEDSLFPDKTSITKNYADMYYDNEGFFFWDEEENEEVNLDYEDEFDEYYEELFVVDS